jgi:hypothetical protein
LFCPKLAYRIFNERRNMFDILRFPGQRRVGGALAYRDRVHTRALRGGERFQHAYARCTDVDS